MRFEISSLQSSMPDALAVVTGTATEIGKTWLTAEVARSIREASIDVAARKPVMSFDVGDATTDAQILAEATGEDESVVCPEHRRYALPMAPPMAADALGRDRLAVDDLVGELALPERGVALVEGVGGLRSPLAHDGDTLSLIDRLDPDYVVIVAPSGLGAINDVLTTRDSLAGRSPIIVFLNRFDPRDSLHVRNLSWLRDNEKVPLAVTPQRIARCMLKLLPNNLGAHDRIVEVQ